MGRDLADAAPEEWSDSFGLSSLDGVLLPAAQVPLHRAIRGERFENQEMAIRPHGTDALVPLSVSGAPLLESDDAPRGGVIRVPLHRRRQEGRGGAAARRSQDPGDHEHRGRGHHRDR